MKFQSLIAAIMHGSRLPARAALVVISCGAMGGCISLIAKKHTYGTAASSPPVRVNGTDIRMQVKPEGTEGGSYALSAMVVSAAVATFDGPFSWRLEAAGEIGKQESLVVHRIRTVTGKTHRDEWYPADHLGKRADFTRRKGETGATRAIYPISGLLKVKPLEDGALDVYVDLTVVSKGRGERKLVHFRMDPSDKRQDEFIFVPTEIAHSIGKSPADWDDAGWD
ncbi:MAG: hypothetical protein ABIS50_04405 [Luteolibacter sp.]|uniref:hypothetical protein n=1 Tax=Luteolibacter sp. TaxID=1962973 RepID=UPI003264F911